MRVLVISLNRDTSIMPTLPLGAASLCEATERAGHAVRLVDLAAAEDPGEAIEQAIRQFTPEVIGLSLRNIDDQNMHGSKTFLESARLWVDHCRNLSSAPLVLGGAGFSIFPEAALEYLGAEMGIQGEGEAAFVLLLDHLQAGKGRFEVPGLHLKGAGPKTRARFETNLDVFPLPSPSLFTIVDPTDQQLWIPVQTRRGCPMDCSYCSTSSIEGRRIRRRSPRKVVQHLESWSRAGYSRFYFVDNLFNVPASHTRELCRLIREAGLSIQWRCILHPKGLDESLVRELALAGCVEASLGFESGAGPVLERMNKRFTPEEARQGSTLLSENGIRQMGFLLLGGPGESRATAEESLAFADSLPLDTLRITTGLRIYPRTHLAEIAVSEGRISGSDDLLRPRFYCAPDLKEWLRDRVVRHCEGRPHCLYE